MKVATKLTSVNIIEEIYKDFKVKSVDGHMTLQKLVNRALDLYNLDRDFRDKLNDHKNLSNKGNKF